MDHYEIYNPSKEELETLKKFSTIRDMLFIENDRISIVDGKMDQSKKLNGMTVCAVKKLDKPYSFEKKIGLRSVSDFLKIVNDKNVDKVEIRVYETHLLVVDKEKKIKVKIMLSPEDSGVIPFTDVEGKIERGFNMPNKLTFRVDWSVLSDLSTLQQKLKKKFFFISEKDNGAVILKIGDNFSTETEDCAEIEIEGNITDNTLDKVKHGGYSKFELVLDNFVEDTYEITINERLVIFKGQERKHNYLFSQIAK